MSRLADLVWCLDNDQPFAQPRHAVKGISEIERAVRTVEVSERTGGAIVRFWSSIGGTVMGGTTCDPRFFAVDGRTLMLDAMMAYVWQEREAMVDAMRDTLSHQPGALAELRRVSPQAREAQLMELWRQAECDKLPKDPAQVRLVDALLWCLREHGNPEARAEAQAALAAIRA